LDRSTLRLASALALLGGEGELEVAAQLANINAGQIIDAVVTLKRAKIIREERREDRPARYSFVHKCAQEIFYQLIPEAERVEGHRRAGNLLEKHLEAKGEKDPCGLAYHFLRAG